MKIRTITALKTTPIDKVKEALNTVPPNIKREVAARVERTQLQDDENEMK